jgi:hypothetical protein
MRRTRKLFMVSVGCAGIVMTLLLTAVLTTHLLANRDMVKTFIVAKTAQATGGILVYDRLDIGFLPVPHLKGPEHSPASGRHIRGRCAGVVDLPQDLTDVERPDQSPPPLRWFPRASTSK